MEMTKIGNPASSVSYSNAELLIDKKIPHNECQQQKGGGPGYEPQDFFGIVGLCRVMACDDLSLLYCWR